MSRDIVVAIMRNNGVVAGSIIQALEKQNRDFSLWLAAEAAKTGMTIAETLVWVALDTFHDDQEMKNKRKLER